MFFSDNKLPQIQTRRETKACFNTLFAAVWQQRNDDYAGILTGNRIPLYGEKTAAMETFSRLLWGIFPLLAQGEVNDDITAEIIRRMAEGTDPSHPHYWGDVQDFDQLSVEMAVFGAGLALAGQQLRDQMRDEEWQRLIAWLRQLRHAKIPANNWTFFPVMIEMGFCLCGESWSMDIIQQHFSRLDSFYCGDGWYSDGLNRPRDYYNGMALHFYGLIYSRLMADYDPQRCAMLRERADLFARDFICFFNHDGAAIAFGRSMTYRFAQAAFWSAAAFAGLSTFPPGVLKGLVLRHLNDWLQRDILDARGVLTVGYGYASDLIAEEYNAPGSPYWACKLFLVLALNDDHPFWASDALPLPAREPRRALPHAGQIVIDDAVAGHHYLLNGGQWPGKNYANSESKYSKFACSSLLGFNLERSRYGMELNACDSMLLLSEHDGYYRGRRTSELKTCMENELHFVWSPWPDVTIYSWLLPLASGHLRLHVVNTARSLHSVEGGFPVPITGDPQRSFDACAGTCISPQHGFFSRMVDLSPVLARSCSLIVSPPASNILYPCCSAVPVLQQDLDPGEHILCCFVHAGTTPPDETALPEIIRQPQHIQVVLDAHVYDIPLPCTVTVE
ncbi:DUF2264 domain-containing protein [Enterobacter sp.]|uniref:DUF2264 domain-containing protein n=1 Tax=Enterobacter sp. TaxID=42895 RepID=UPI00296F9120|nr:DUF2264 domain-containing protein [Enterobacter sp.]